MPPNQQSESSEFSAENPSSQDATFTQDTIRRRSALALLATRYNRSNPIFFSETIDGEFSLYSLTNDVSSTFYEIKNRIQKVDLDKLEEIEEHLSALEFLFSYSDDRNFDLPAQLPALGIANQTKAIQFVLADDTLTASLFFDSSSSDPTASQFIEHFKNGVLLASSSIDRIFARTPIQSKEDYHLQVHSWNDTFEPCEIGRFGFERIDDAAGLFPNDIAVESSDASITYSELVDRANRFAHHLIENGVGPNQIVCVYMRRSIELVIAIVGIQKAGGAFLLVDPTLPIDRIDTMLTHSKTRHIVALSNELPQIDPKQYHLHTFDKLKHIFENCPSESPEIRLKNDDLSCVFYTSGSTGEPKGVAMGLKYRGLSDKPLEKLTSTRGKLSLLKSSTGFTLILHEIFTTLQTAGRILVVPQGLEKDMGWLVSTIVERQVNAASFAPSLLSLILDEPEISKCDCIETVYTVGETLPVSTQKEFHQKLPNAKLMLFYGCTEAPALTLREIDADEDFDGKTVIGKPKSNKKIYLLDKYEVPVPVGASGEIYGAGDLSIGYLNNEALTRQKFRPNPFDQTENARIYQTGDLGRYLPDGNIEFLGRSDFQVQVRGIRIELSEIESAIDSHPAVKKSVVVTRGEAGETQLLAYYTYHDAPPQEHEIRNLLRNRLPEYMIPQYFTRLSEFPLIHSGKLDRKSLPEPSLDLKQSRRIVSPYNSIQIKLELVFKQVLKRDTISIEDDFFELGGDSFLAVKALSRINRSFNTKLEIPELYKNRTILSLEKIVTKNGYQSPLKFLVEINDPPFESAPNLFIFGCSSTIKSYLEKDLKINLMRSLWFDRNFDYSDTVESVARKYAADIETVQSSGPYLLAGYSMGAVLAHTFACQSQTAGQEVRALHLIDPATPPLVPERQSKSNLQHFIRHLGAHNITDQRAFAVAQLFNLLRIPIPYRIQSRAAWFYIANLLSTSSPQPYQGDATMYVRSNYRQENIDRWKSLIEGTVEIIKLPVETHAAVDEHQMQKIWCEQILKSAQAIPVEV